MASLDECIEFGRINKHRGSNPIASRLHFISEGGGKTRVVAICDY